MLRAIVLAAAVLVGGCGGGGPPVVPVAGVVTVNGKPAADLVVGFDPVTTDPGRPPFGSRAVTDDQGRFTLVCSDGRPGAVPGSHKVTVLDNAYANIPDDVPTKKLPRNRVPVVYGQASSTPLTVTVEAGKADYLLDVKAK